MIIKDLGAVTAYAAAVEKGYTGTEEEFATLMASYASVAEEAAESAESAQASATTASSAASTATTKASEATTAAQIATAKAEEAQADADAAALDASQALSAASTATSKASEAAQSASDASAAKTAAQTAQTAAESSATTAQTAAQTATQKAAEAAESARTLTIDTTLTQSGQAADSKVVGNEIGEVKSDLRLLIDNTELAGTEKTGYWRNGVFTENSGKYTKRFNVDGLGIVQLTEYATLYRDAYVFIDSSNNVISSAVGGADPGTDGYTIVLPVPDEAVYLDSSVNSASNLSKVKLETPTPKVSTNDIDNLQNQIDLLGGLDFAVLNGNNVNVFYRGKTLRTGLSSPYSRKFKVVGGRKYKISLTTGADFNAYTFIDASQNILSYELATSAESKEYIVDAPDGATMLYCSTNSGSITSVAVYQQISGTDVINEITKNEYLASIIHNVICIGDSLTQGYRNDTLHNIEAYSYPTFLSRIANWEVVNAGWAGITPLGWWDKRTLYTYGDKQFAIIKLGQNQGLTDTLAEDTSASSYEDYANTNTGAYCKIIEYIKEQNPHIIIFIVSVKAYRDSVTNDVLQQIADKYNLPFIDLNDSRFNLEAADIHTINGNYDAVHFNTLGYSQLATSIYDLIVLYLANNKNLMMNYGEW